MFSKWMEKNKYYPDLLKRWQVSNKKLPTCVNPVYF